MSDSTTLKRCLAVFGGQIKLIAAEITQFDILTQSVNCIVQWKYSLEACREKHQKFIGRMMVNEGADSDEIDDLAEVFQAQFSEAMNLLEACKKSRATIEQHRRNNEKDKAIFEILLLQVEEVEAFKDAYDAERSTLSELQLRVAHLKQMQEKFVRTSNEILPRSEESTQTYLSALNRKFSAIFFDVFEWLNGEISHRRNGNSAEGSKLSHVNVSVAQFSDTTAASATFPSNSCPYDDNVTLLQTTMVKFHSSHGGSVIDSGADLNFITAKVAKASNLKMPLTHVDVDGLVGKRIAEIRHASRANVSNDDEHNDIDVSLNVSKPFITDIDRLSMDFSDEFIPADLQVPEKMDNLLGNKIYGKLMRNEKHDLTFGIATIGWDFTDSSSSRSAARSIATAAIDHIRLKNTNEKFFKLEDFKTDKDFLSDNKALCDQTHERLPDRTLTVHSPFEKNVRMLEPSDRSTLCQFLSNEKGSQRNESQCEQNGYVMQKLEDTGLIKEVTKDSFHSIPFYSSHQGVDELDSTSTQLHFDFNNFLEITSDVSLNDTQRIRLNMQTSSFSHRLRFQRHRIAINADIAKMCRQDKIEPHHRQNQWIFCRKKPPYPDKFYETTAATFGIAASAFLATCAPLQTRLHCINESQQDTQEIIEIVVNRNTLSGECSFQNANALHHDAVEELDFPVMKIRKLSFSYCKFIQASSVADLEVVDEGKTLKAMIFRWDERKDTRKPNLTFSEMFCSYDPDGLILPASFKLREYLTKKTHQLNTDWDAPLPTRKDSKWKTLLRTFEKLKIIETFSYFLIDSPLNIQLYDCRDASDVSYGAALYVITRDVLGRRNSDLVCAESRNAPTENCSTPHCSIAQLITRAGKPLTITSHRGFFRMFSSSFLHRLREVSTLNKTCVANRKAKVQELTAAMIWRSTRTELNTADTFSRGILPMDFVDCLQWWQEYDFVLHHETQLLIATIHQTCFKEEFRRMSAERSTPPSSFVKILSLFSVSQLMLIRFGDRLDIEQRSKDQTHLIVLIHVDERLELVQFCHKPKHLILLSKYQYAKIMIREIRERVLHAVQHSFDVSRMMYWPVRRCQIVKLQIHKRFKHFRARSEMIAKFMRSLSAYQVTPTLVYRHNFAIDCCAFDNVKCLQLTSLKLKSHFRLHCKFQQSTIIIHFVHRSRRCSTLSRENVNDASYC